MKALPLITVMVLLSLTGCNAANVQPQVAANPVQPAPPQEDQSSLELQSQFENLNSRITLLQEQFLELKVQNSSIAQRIQLLLTQFQVLAQEVKRSTTSGSVSQAPPDGKMAELVTRLDQQLLELQQSAPEFGAASPFLLATCYTGKGQWILIRYNRFSGESWISGDSSWQPLGEDSALSISDYEIQLQPANNDVKGYVAARIDHNSGTTWWLNKEQWVLYKQ